MLVIRPKTQGAGIFDVISKVANSAIAKKVINSAVGKQVIKHATKENFKKAANSAIGKQLKTALVSSVADASEKVANNALQKLGLESTTPGTIAKASEKAANLAFEKLGVSEPATFSETKKPKRKRKEPAVDSAFKKLKVKPEKRKIALSRTPGRKRRKFGRGIILE